MEKKILCTYLPFYCHVVMANMKRAAAQRRPAPERGVVAYTRPTEREQTILIGWPSDIGKKFHSPPLDHVQVAAVRAAWHES